MNHALCFDGANGSRGFSGNSRADMRQCMIHLSQLTNVLRQKVQDLCQ
jgi:hypothetical protein